MDEIPIRKANHIDITTQRTVTPDVSPGWDDVQLVHQALPEIDLDEVDLGIDLFGCHLRAPILIASMTGGHPRAAEINRRLAGAAQAYGLAMGVGSQRAAIRQPELLATYTVAREAAPDALLIANVGAPQLIPQGSEAPLVLGDVERLVSTLEANALAIHLNYLQEVVQPEGDTRARGALAAIERIARALSVPIIAKETGAGIAREQGARLVSAGVAGIDVGGAGGTSFALVESHRAADRGLARAARLGEALAGWGIPSAASVMECQGLGVPVIATGGVRSGLHVAAALALGANVVGLARPLLSAALESEAVLHDFV
ncbi:MAG: isopentenyl-diphosphate Delta-isomerase, partial [Chloroflexota bacterium]|nr:isopentenyl-diphosphate Delta-isomerase [Chloroflexota bacterium]